MLICLFCKVTKSHHSSNKPRWSFRNSLSFILEPFTISMNQWITLKDVWLLHLWIFCKRKLTTSFALFFYLQNLSFSQIYSSAFFVIILLYISGLLIHFLIWRNFLFFNRIYLFFLLWLLLRNSYCCTFLIFFLIRKIKVKV